MQYMVIALTCYLPFTLQAARVVSEARLFPPPAVRFHRPDGARVSDRPRVATRTRLQKEPLDGWPEWASNQTYKVAAHEILELDKQERLAWAQKKDEYSSFLEAMLGEALAIRELVGQPAVPWGLDQCLGRDVLLPKQDYHVKEASHTSTPYEAFQIMDGDHTDLTLSTPWNSEVGVGVEELGQSDSEWAHLLRGECCGLRATLLLETEDDSIRGKIQCLGAPEGWQCRLDAPLQSHQKAVCTEGYTCGKTATSHVDGIGECQPEGAQY